jgi:hypothetical protein
MAAARERLVICLRPDPDGPRLPESRLVDGAFVYGGDKACMTLAFATAALGREVELRGPVHRETFETFRNAVGAAPRVDLLPRPIEDTDVVLVPEGWQDPLGYLFVALSPARIVLFVLAAPGLFGWPFTRSWSPPDPLTVPIDSLARPEHFQGMRALGFELITHSRGLERVARAAGAPCTFVGATRPTGYPKPTLAKTIDVAALTANRWERFARQVLTEIDGELTVDAIPEVPNDEVLRRFERARVLAWPSRVEGHATIPIEARAMGCVPVALDTNRFAADLDEEHGAVTVGAVEEIAPAIRALLADPRRLEELRARGRDYAVRAEDWERYVSRVDAWLSAPPEQDAGRGARLGAGAALRERLEEPAALREELRIAKGDLTQATENQQRMLDEIEWLRGRKLRAAAMYRLRRLLGRG